MTTRTTKENMAAAAEIVAALLRGEAVDVRQGVAKPAQRPDLLSLRKADGQMTNAQLVDLMAWAAGRRNKRVAELCAMALEGREWAVAVLAPIAAKVL